MLEFNYRCLEALAFAKRTRAPRDSVRGSCSNAMIVRRVTALALLLAVRAVGQQSGVYIEEIEKGSPAEQAGLRVGDLIVAWSQGTDSGTIESPFDWIDFEFERAPRGAAAVRLYRGSEELTDTFHAGAAGAKMRPVLSAERTRLWLLCRSLEHAGKTTQVAEGWRTLIGQAGPADPPWLRAWLDYQLAQVLAGAHQFTEADDAFGKAIERLAAAPMRGSWWLEYEWARTFWNHDDFAHTREHFELSLAQARRLESPSLAEAINLSQLGNISEWDQAEQYHLQALAIRHQLAPHSIELTNSWNNLGNLALFRGDLDLAENYQRQALALRDELAPGGVAVAATLNNLALVLDGRGDKAQAEDLYLRALAIQQKFDDLNASATLLNLGTLAAYRGDFDRAEDYYQRCLAIRRKSGSDPLSASDALTDLGDLAIQRGDPAKAERYLKEALAVQKKVDPNGREAAMSMNGLGDAARALGDLAEAEADQKRSLEEMGRIAPGSLEIATVLTSAGATALARGDLAAAEEYHRRALAIRHRLEPGSSEEAESLHYLGVVAQRKESPDDARSYFARAVDALEAQTAHLGGTETVRAGFRVKYAAYYEDLEHAWLARNDPAQAFHVSERARARSLLEMMAQRDLVFAADVPVDQQRARKRNAAEYDHVQAQIAGLNATKEQEKIASLLARLRELNANREQITEQIRKTSPRFASLEYPEPLDLAATRQTLDPGTALLSYTAGAEKTVLFVVQPAASEPGLSVFTLPVTGKELEARVSRFRRLIQAHRAEDAAKLTALSRRLYDLLMKPAEPAVSQSARLVIIPDGALEVLPFAALQRNRREYLVDWKPVHTVASATVYAELQKGRHPQQDKVLELVAFGDPRVATAAQDAQARSEDSELRAAATRGLTFGRLPFSRQEVEAIAGLFPNRSRTYLGADASEEHAKAVGKAVRYIHFATHGVFDERLPLNSALVLTIPNKAGEGRDNGLLQAWEILEQLRIDADLVTLSACNTGLGKDLRGEGLIGLTRAFQYAGARSVLASLWSVDDFQTMELMRHFYAGLRAGRTKDEALRAAQAALAHSQSSAAPYYWAGFSLSGDWK